MPTSKSVSPRVRGQRLHGRDRAFKRTLLTLQGSGPGACVLITGRRGSGRTAFLDAVAEALAAERTVYRVRGRSDLSAVSLGALAPLLAAQPQSAQSAAVDVVGAADAVGVFGAAGVFGAGASDARTSDQPLVRFHRALNRPGVVLVVDDADLLDPASACVLEQVRQGGQAALVVSRRLESISEPGTRDRLENAVPGALQLGRDASAVFELTSLSAGEGHSLVKDRLGPSVGDAAAAEMVRLAAGSVQTLVELIEASAGACELGDDAGSWQEQWPYVSAGLVASLPANPLQGDFLIDDLMTVLAVCGDLPVEQAGTSGVSERATRRAEALGLVKTRHTDGRSWVRLAHPLYSAVVLATVTELDRGDFAAAGADMLDGYPLHRVRRILLMLTAGQPVAPRVLVDLARAELGEQRYATAIRLGEQATATAGADRMLRAAGEYVQAQALSQIGRIREAGDHFAAAWAALDASEGGVDEEFVAALAQAEGNHLAFRTLRPDLAVLCTEPVLGRLTDPAVSALIESDLAKWRLMAGQGMPADLDAVPDPLGALGPVETSGDLNLLIMTATLQTMGGNLRLAQEAVQRGLAECDRFRDVLPNARDLLQLSEVLVLAFTDRFLQARAAARANLARAEESNPSAKGVWKFALAMIELHTGSPARAWKLIIEGRRDLVWRDIAGLLPSADALSAAIAARTGRFAIARSWLDQLTPAEVRDPKVELYASLARAWVSASAGRPGFAIRSLAPALQQAVDGGHRYLAALVAYEAVRIEPLVGSTVMLPYLVAARHAFPLCEAHARAVAARQDVLPVAKQLAEAGLLGPAIDAARWAAGHAGDDLVQAARAHRLADSWTVRTGVSMANRQRQDEPRVTPLTDREWQLASGAAAFRTSAELAAEFGISVRTVDNHLARIYKKLGVAGRRELSAELSELQLDHDDYATGTGSTSGSGSK